MIPQIKLLTFVARNMVLVGGNPSRFILVVFPFRRDSHRDVFPKGHLWTAWMFNPRQVSRL